jgi:hypothetical protein
MSGENVRSRYDLIEDKIYLIKTWAEQHPEFDTEFVDSLLIQLEARGNLSDRQVAALDSILDKWEID